MDTTASILSVDLEGHTALLETYDVSKVREAVDSYREIVRAVVESFQGVKGTWAGDGGWFFFQGPRHGDRAVWAGRSILSSIRLLNEDEGRNPLPEPLKVRVAAGIGRLPMEGEPEEMISAVIGAVEDLQKNGTRAGGFSIFGDLYRALTSRVQESLQKRKKQYRGETVFYLSRHEIQRSPSPEELTRLLEETELRCRAVLKILGENSAAELDGFLAVEAHRALQEAYERVFAFLRHYSEIRRIWDVPYTRQVGDTAEHLLALQDELWATLEAWFSSGPTWHGLTPELDRIRTLLLGSYLEARGGLSYVKDKAEQGLAAKETTSSLRHQLAYEGLQELVAASDELDRLEAFIKVFHYDRRELLHFLSNGVAEDLRRRVQDALWPHAELVVAEDLACEKRGLCLPGGVVGILADGSPRGRAFRGLQRALLAQQLPSSEWWRRAVAAPDARLRSEELTTLLRCLVLGHESPSLQYLASKELGIEDFWPLVAYQRIPIRTLTITTRKLEEWPDSNARKIFFDAVRSRLHREIDHLKPNGGVPEVLSLVASLLTFEEWVEDRYFRDVELLVSHVEARLALFRESLPPVLDSRLRMLSDKRERAGFPRTRLPERVRRLPAPLKLHLVRQGFYVPPFACDEEERIALETRDFITPSTLPAVLDYVDARESRAIHQALFMDLMKSDELVEVWKRHRERKGRQSRSQGARVDLAGLPKHERDRIERLLGLHRPCS